MGLREDIQQQLTEAMKKKEADKLATLRLLWSAIRTEEIDKKRNCDDSEILSVISRQIKQLEDAHKDFSAGGRLDLIEKTEKELAHLRGYLPPQMSDEELDTIIRRVVHDVGAPTEKDVGRVIGLVMKEVRGKADGNRVREHVMRIVQGG